MINSRRFERARAYVRRSGVAADLERELRAKPGGRHRALPVDVLLAAMMCCVDERHSLALTKVHELMTTDLSRQLQTQIGVRDRSGDAITIRQVRYLWNAITDLFEHSPSRRPNLSDVERAERADALAAFSNKLLGSAALYLDDTGCWAIDATAIDSAARGAARGAPSADPDARWGYRTRTFDNKTKKVFGYQMIALARVGKVGQLPPPLLTERIAVVPGNSHGIGETLDILDRLADNGRPVAEIIADRGFSYATHEDWADQLRARGIEQVQDIHPADHGQRVHPDHGYLMIDGWPHCPSIPEHLKRINRPATLTIGELRKNATRKEKAEHAARAAELEGFAKLIAERRLYRFEKVGKTSSGADRFRCPARAGKIKCSGYPASRYLPDGTPEGNPQDPPAKACSQATITIKRTVEPKLRQRDYWGSPEWIRSYSRRTRVEGSFGLLKSPKTSGVKRGWTHQVGLVKTTCALTIAVAATNLRQLLTWATDTGDTRDPLTRIDVTDHGFVELDAAGNLAGGVSPPAAA